jgi:hypothetical protein
MTRNLKKWWQLRGDKRAVRHRKSAGLRDRGDVSGVSQLALTKSQFLGVLKDKGFDGLISMLREKTRGFSEGKEE